MDNELQQLLDDYGVDTLEKADELPAEALDALKQAMKILVKYKDDYPEDLRDALGVIAQAAAGNYGKKPVQKDDDDDDISKGNGNAKWPSLAGAVTESQVQDGQD